LENNRVIKIACGGYHSLVLTSDGELYAFGSGAFGECGFGETKDTAKPRKVDFGSTKTEL
jgi:RCC1 and BTB domain-containing protein